MEPDLYVLGLCTGGNSAERMLEITLWDQARVREERERVPGRGKSTSLPLPHVVDCGWLWLHWEIAQVHYFIGKSAASKLL